MNTNTTAVKLFDLLTAICIFIALDHIGCYITDNLSGSFGYVWLIIHHSIQLILAVLIMLLPIWKRSLAQWGLNLNNWSDTVHHLKIFTVGWIICTALFTLGSQYFTGWAALIHFEMNFSNIASYLLFESSIVGLSEEIVFRGLVFGILFRSFYKQIKLAGITISQAGLITALLFSLAHVGFNLFPFEITSFDPMQLLAAFGLSIFYSFLYEKTGSLLGPILAHNLADGWLSLLYIFIHIFTR